MYKTECYKIFTRKSIYFSFLLFALFMLLPGGSDDIIQSDEYETMYEVWKGTLTAEEIETAVERQMELDARLTEEFENAGEFEGPMPVSDEDRAALTVYNSVVWTGGYMDAFEERKEDLQNDVASSETSDYEEKAASKELSMLENVGNPFGFYNTTAVGSTADFVNTLGFIILTVMIVLGLAPVFADEHSQKTASLIASTKHGKRKIVTAKIMASLTYIALLFTALHVLNAGIRWVRFGGFADGGVPLQNLYLFLRSPFDLSIWEYYGVALGIQFFAALVIGLLVLFLSIVTRHAMLAFFLAGVITGTPFLLRMLGLEQGIIRYVVQFSYAELMRVRSMFDQFTVFNVFGQPVLYHYLLLFIFVIIAVVNVVLIYRQYKNQEILG